MLYTIKNLSKISGVTVRTLQYYDKIGLLKPYLKGSNNYRYYKEEQLIKLQQVLFFKELDFSLNDIKTLIAQNDFDNINALKAHRIVLEKQIAHKNDLIKTINKTMMHLEGKEFMKDEELYYGFDKKLPKSNEYTSIARGAPEEKMFEHFKKDDVIWSEQQWSDFKNEADSLNKDIAKLISQNAKPENEDVQVLIQKHYNLQSNFFNLTHDAYLALMQMYKNDNSTIAMFFEVYHPKMQKFMCEAMKYYAEKNL